MPTYYPYLIIGGGMTADAAARGIHQVDAGRPIGMISAETVPPYNRPPLSKGLWKINRPAPMSRVWRNTESLGVALHLGHTAVHLDPVNHRVKDEQGQEYTFEKLLIATGGDPIRPWGLHERVVYFRTLADYERLRSMTETMQRFIVIGGGFVGSEIAAALAQHGKDVTMVFPETGIGARVLPDTVSQLLNRTFRERGVRVLDGKLVSALQPDATGVTVVLTDGEALRAEGVVAGLGIRPNISLAQSAGLATGNGILVDEHLRTNHPDIYAAGDVSNFYSPVLSMRMRVEHEENANLGGMLAGQAMAGQPEPYQILPSVYSTLFGISYDAVGELDPALEITYDWQDPLQKGAFYYMKDGRVRGVVLWNIGRGLDQARALIAEPGPFRVGDLQGRFAA